MARYAKYIVRIRGRFKDIRADQVTLEGSVMIVRRAVKERGRVIVRDESM